MTRSSHHRSVKSVLALSVIFLLATPPTATKPSFVFVDAASGESSATFPFRPAAVPIDRECNASDGDVGSSDKAGSCPQEDHAPRRWWPWKRSFAEFYMILLEERPILTKSATAGLLAIAGDILAQSIESRLESKGGGVATGGNAKTTNTAGRQPYDGRRIFAMFADGFICTGPIMHYAYNMYESVVPIQVDEDGGDGDDDNGLAVRNMRRKVRAALIQILFDIVFMAFPYVFTMMAMSAIIEGRLGGFRKELMCDFLPAVKGSWVASCGLGPIQFFSFLYLPVQLRALAVNLTDIIWVSVVSYVTHIKR